MIKVHDMWLSKKIEKDPETKRTLKEISKLITDYSDATKITKQKFWSIQNFRHIDIGRCFRPRAITYIIALFITMVTATLLFYLGIADFQHLVDLSKFALSISVPILVLGITLSNAIKGMDKESRFATEYLKESCRTISFTCLTFLTVLAGVFLVLINEPTTRLASIIFLCFFSFGVGGTIWCLMSQVYVIVETINCMTPEISTKMASNYSARKTIHAFMKKAYIDVWMGKFSELLETELKKFENVFHYNEYDEKYYFADNEKRYPINLPKKVDAKVGFRDYNLGKLKKINRSLETKKAELYLTPNSYITEECGILYCTEECNKLSKLIEKRKFCKYRKDKYIEAENSFWNDHHRKLFNSIRKAVEAEDVAQFREYLISIESIFIAIRYARKNSLLRKYTNRDYNKYRFLRIYSSSMKWILQLKIEDEVRAFFIEEIVESIERQAKDDIASGDWYTIDTFKWIFRDTYKLFEQHKNTPLWEKRAEIGRFYYYAEYALADKTLNLSDEQALQIKLTLHTGIVSWLRVAIKNEDKGLIKDLCESARKLAFPDKTITFTPNKLVTQHFILCGKMLKHLTCDTPTIDGKIFQSLLFDEYDHSTKYGYNYKELVDFYIENRKNNLREYLHEFCETVWEDDRPLCGVRHGTPHYDFDGTDLDYAFIYLALLMISENEQKRAIEFWHYNIKDKIKTLEKAANIIEFYNFESQKNIFEKWMDDCAELYKNQEEQKVAEAPLNPNKVSEYIDSFWTGYKERNTFLKFCFKYGYYAIIETAITKGIRRLPKTIFLEKTHECGSIGTSSGSEVSASCDKELIRKLIKHTSNDNNETANNIENALNQACQWLQGKGLRETEGIIVYCGNTFIEGELYKNEYYVPSWKNEKEKYFSGYYKNYPIKIIYNRGEIEKCVALELRGWKGIQVRADIIDKENFGNLKVRGKSEDEITKDIEKDPKLTIDDRNKLKGTCLAEYELYWQVDNNNLPDQMTISMVKETDVKDGSSGQIIPPIDS